ncbi:MAG: hypothetical protein ACNI3A_18670 [Desulfovibrio sp.]|uniref:hypothetical protein n=1 Tax=Desulfovibrio sp. 7SRBS1 TaxID=3378064 RepID=UPI003B3CD8C0
MDPATLTKITAALTAIAKIVEALGPGGVIALALAGPVVVVVAVLILAHLNNKRMARSFDEYRIDADRRFEAYRDQTSETLESYGAVQRETAQYYRDNVELVRSVESLARGFQDVVVTNTRTLERLCNDVEHHVFCPVARESKGLPR